MSAEWKVRFAISKTSNAHKNSAAHIQEKNSSYTAMPTARQKILSTSWNVQFVVFGWFFEDFTQFWVFLYGCPVLTNDAG
jgi:hypothetical protein